MARAHRVAGITTFFTILYVLVFFETVQVPFVEEKVVNEILPVVRGIQVVRR